MRSTKVSKTDTETNRERILRTLGGEQLTINECIDKIFKSDIRTGKIGSKNWRYYVHLNKLFDPMKKASLIKVVGAKIGPTNKTEKVWAKC
jgi:hypothetical protein